MKFDEQRILAALYHSWSIVTASQWTPENPGGGQCNVTAMLVHDLFGGEILKTPLEAGEHYYNRIDDTRFDFTASQFAEAIDYADIVSDRAAAGEGVTRHEYTTLRTAFEKHF